MTKDIEKFIKPGKTDRIYLIHLDETGKMKNIRVCLQILR
jgi:hypothetical protein